MSTEDTYLLVEKVGAPKARLHNLYHQAKWLCL